MSKRVFRARKTDQNQPEIVAAYREMGVCVCITSSLGGGFPDLVVGLGGVVDLVEVKDGSKPPSARRLTDDERRFSESFPVVVVESTEQANAHVERLRQKAKALAELLEAGCIGK